MKCRSCDYTHADPDANIGYCVIRAWDSAAGCVTSGARASLMWPGTRKENEHADSTIKVYDLDGKVENEHAESTIKVYDGKVVKSMGH